MPTMTKSPPELTARFEAFCTRFPEGRPRKMFGYPALFVGGNLATSLFRARWVVRLGAADLVAALALPGADRFEPMAGRPMTGYALLPTEIVADDDALADWVGRAIAFARTLPPK
jgi:TfoX/Sxy family transcriptional regulator of competence genes